MLKRGEGETIQAIRCRLAAAVEALGKERQVRQHRQHRLLLGAGDPAPRQALQRPDRVGLPPRLLDPTTHLFIDKR